jgi:GR25 family glycosyltransferase involved in LPS biosynthesis
MVKSSQHLYVSLFFFYINILMHTEILKKIEIDDNNILNRIKEYETDTKDNVLFSTLVGGLGNQLLILFNLLSLGIDNDMDIYIDKHFQHYQHHSYEKYHFFKNISGININEIQAYTTYEEPEYKYNKISLDKTMNTKVAGYFQSYKYFWHNKDKIKDMIYIDNSKLSQVKQSLSLYEKIIAIHVRLTDYTKLPEYHPIPTFEYYKKSLSSYDLNNYTVILFSDDTEEAKKILSPLNIKNIVMADDINSDDEYQFLMLCLSDVRICANSTFSLMSCYFNEIFNFKSGCEYIFPKKWFGSEGPSYDICDIIPVDNYRFKLVDISSENLKVSILIPTHDLKGEQIKFMKKALPIIFNQTYKNFEIVITDNNDTTETKDFIINDFKNYYLTTNPSKSNIDTFDINKIKYTYCKIKGWSPNHNHGLDLCTGDLIKILHQDNYFLNEFSLENIVAAFNNNDINWLVSSYYHQNENESEGELYRNYIPEYIDEIVNGENLLGDPSCLTLKKKCVLKFKTSMKYYVDCEYYFRLKQKFGLPFVLKISNIVVLQHDKQVTHTLTIKEVLKEHFELKKIGNDYGINFDEYPWWVNDNTFSSNSKIIYDRELYEYKKIMTNTFTYNEISEMIKTYYINLNERGDRNLEILTELKKCNITNYERFSAIKPDKDMINNCNLIEVDKLWPKDGNPPNINDEIDFKYIRGATGCKLSHYKILKKFYFEDKYKYLLVLEDDCVLATDTLNIINNSLSYLNKFNVKFNILYLSATIHHHEYYNFAEKISEKVLKLKKGWGNTTHAMIFSRDTVNDVIKILGKSNNEIDDVYKNKVDNRYITHPVIGFQRKSPSDIGLFREEKYNITDNEIVFYGELDKRYNYSNIDCVGIKYLIYRSNKEFNNKMSESFYNFLISDLNLGEVKHLDNYNKNVTYICFSNQNEINVKINFIYVNDNSVDITFFNNHLNMKFFIELDIDRFNKLREDFSVRDKLAYINSNTQSLYSGCVTTNIIDINKYHIEMNSETLYVVNLLHSVKRKERFINNNININYEFISAILYNPGWLGCSLSHKLLVKNADRNKLEYVKICEDDCIISDENIINMALETLKNSKKPFELLSCFMSNVTDDVIIEDIINLNGNYKLLKINEWTSTVFNIYHKNSYKYFLNYDEKKANDKEKDKDGNLIWTIDRFLKFKHIWVIYPYPIRIIDEISEIWKSSIFNGDNYNDYVELKDKSLCNLKKKLDDFNE